MSEVGGEDFAGKASRRRFKPDREAVVADGHGWVLKQALTKLRVDVDWFSSPERIGVEAKAIRWLNALAPKGTTPFFIFDDIANHLVAMEAIPSESENW